MHRCEVLRVFKVFIVAGSFLPEVHLNSAVSTTPSILTRGLCEGGASPPCLTAGQGPLPTSERRNMVQRTCPSTLFSLSSPGVADTSPSRGHRGAEAARSHGLVLAAQRAGQPKVGLLRTPRLKGSNWKVEEIRETEKPGIRSSIKLPRKA